jgi:signal recognition particle subunit SRP54
VQEINKLLKMHRTMADMMKAMGKRGGGAMAGLASKLGLGGLGGGQMPSPEDMQKLAEKMPGGLPGLPKNFPGGGLPPGLPGLGNLPKGLPGLGFPPGKKK